MRLSSHNVATDHLSSPLRVISSLLIRRYSERGLSLPRFWSAWRKRKALLRPDLLAAKYTASASTRAQASAAFLEDMRAHCLTVSTNGKHHVGRRPNARSIAAASATSRGGKQRTFTHQRAMPPNTNLRPGCRTLRYAPINPSCHSTAPPRCASPQEQGQSTLDVPAHALKCSRRRRAIKPHTRQQR